jgi:hypothetical protein
VTLRYQRHPATLPLQVLRERFGTVDQVLLEIPYISRSRRRRIVDDLETPVIHLLQVPLNEENGRGHTRIEGTRHIAIDQLFGCDTVTFILPCLALATPARWCWCVEPVFRFHWLHALLPDPWVEAPPFTPARDQ